MKAAAYLKAHPNILRIGAVVVFFIAWEFFGRDVNPLFLSYPTAIGRAFMTITSTGELQRAFMASMVPFSIGLVISIVGGMIIGVATAHLWWLDQMSEPFLNALYAIPRVALVPLIILWAGLEFVGKVTILVSVAILPITVNTYAGIRDVRGSMLETAAPMVRRSGKFSPRSCCRRRSPSSWRGCGWRSGSPSSASSSPSSSPPSAGSAA